MSKKIDWYDEEKLLCWLDYIITIFYFVQSILLIYKCTFILIVYMLVTWYQLISLKLWKENKQLFTQRRIFYLEKSQVGCYWWLWYDMMDSTKPMIFIIISALYSISLWYIFFMITITTRAERTAAIEKYNNNGITNSYQVPDRYSFSLEYLLFPHHFTFSHKKNI